MEAARIGLVNHVVPGNQLEPKLLEVLSKLRELSAASLQMTKKAIDLGRGRPIDSVLAEVENVYLHELMKTKDANEGINAFVGKRKPVWSDR